MRNRYCVTLNFKNNSRTEKVFFYFTSKDKEKKIIMNWYVPAPFTSFIMELKASESLSASLHKFENNKKSIISNVKWVKNQDQYGVILKLNGERYIRLIRKNELDMKTHSLFCTYLNINIDESELIKIDNYNWSKSFIFEDIPTKSGKSITTGPKFDSK